MVSAFEGNRAETKTMLPQAGRQTITAADPLPDDLHHALDAINRDN